MSIINSVKMISLIVVVAIIIVLLVHCNNELKKQVIKELKEYPTEPKIILKEDKEATSILTKYSTVREIFGIPFKITIQPENISILKKKSIPLKAKPLEKLVIEFGYYVPNDVWMNELNISTGMKKEFLSGRDFNIDVHHIPNTGEFLIEKINLIIPREKGMYIYNIYTVRSNKRVNFTFSIKVE